MLSLILAVAAGAAVFAAVYPVWPFAGKTAWCVLFGLLAVALVQILVSLYIRKTASKIQMKIQSIMLAVQEKIQSRQNFFMRRGGGNQKLLMQQLQHEQTAGLEQALAVCDEFKILYKWNFFMPKQVNTMKMLFCYQLKRFDEVDKLMPKCMFLDPQSIAVKLARMYKLKDETIGKFFKKAVRRIKKDDTVLPYCVYAWILLKQNKAEEARTLLTEAKTKTSHPVIERNWEALSNQKLKQFSNADLGDAWYALGLEEPKAVRVQQQIRGR